MPVDRTLLLRASSRSVGVCAQSDRDQQRNIGEMTPIPDGRADLLASFSVIDFNPSAPRGVGIVADDREAVEWEGCRLGCAGLAM
ncbi:hypothetical protein [Rhizobium laguerreae]|uniref:hypothetical protein n=1 Tax=Rhizobium laguerreae TaxID=1076926 RepID=UPI0010528B99|nr:hypothetical protein [Rhizobium laguerreae]